MVLELRLDLLFMKHCDVYLLMFVLKIGQIFSPQISREIKKKFFFSN